MGQQYRHILAVLIWASIALTTICCSPSANASGAGVQAAVTGPDKEKRPNLASAFGKGLEAYAKVVGAKIEPATTEIPDMVPGKNYTDQELAALPKIKELIWKGKLKGVGPLTLRATSKSPNVVYVWVDFDSSGMSWKDAVGKLGLNPEEITAKQDSHGDWELTPKKAKTKPSWDAIYNPKDPDREGKQDEMEIAIG